jgi:hypothetical protein
VASDSGTERDPIVVLAGYATEALRYPATTLGRSFESDTAQSIEACGLGSTPEAPWGVHAPDRREPLSAATEREGKVGARGHSWCATSTARAEEPVNAGSSDLVGVRGPQGGPSSDTEGALERLLEVCATRRREAATVAFKPPKEAFVALEAHLARRIVPPPREQSRGSGERLHSPGQTAFDALRILCASHSLARLRHAA